MSRYRKIILTVLACLAGLLLIALVAAIWIGPRVKEIVVGQINNYLTVPVQVDEISFSFIKHFPYGAVDFTGVRTKGNALTKTGEPLLDAGHIYFLFNIFDVFNDDLKLKKISIKDARLYLLVNEKGKTNFDIFKKSNGNNQKFSLALEEVELDHVRFVYHSALAKLDYIFSTNNAKLKGKFKQQQYDLAMNGDLFVEKFRVNSINYIDHKETNLHLDLHINNETSQYTISNAEIKIADLKLAATGVFQNKENGLNMDLSIQSKDAGLHELLSLIPGNYTSKLNNFRYTGNIYFTMRISGVSGDKTTPLVSANFGTENASLMPKSSDYKLSNIRFKGEYISNISNAKQVSRLQLNDINAVLEGQPVKASLLIEDFNNPYIDISAKSAINLSVLSNFYMPDTLQSISGKVIVDARIRGRSNDQLSWISEGTVIAEQVNFRLKSKALDFTNFNGQFNLQGNQLTVTDLRGNAAQSDFTINGTFNNVLGYLLTKDEKISGDARVSSRNLDLNELLENKKQSTATDTMYRLDFSNRVDLKLQVSIGILSFRKFQAWQSRADISIRNKILTTSDLSFKSFNGTLALDGSINTSKPDSILIICDASVSKLDMNQLFSQMENFGQTILTDKNVKGNISATIQFASTWSKSLNCNPDRIFAKSDLTIENGELINFQPMLALSKYLKGADLQRVKFNTLHNRIEIKNQTITIPEMEIKSSALDLTASGTHTFSNQIDYKLQLYLSQLLGKKVKEQNTEFGKIEDDGLGRTKLFLTMKGALANPKITYDRKGVEQKITQDIKQEKQTFKTLIKQEFGWGKKDSTISTPKKEKPKKEELQLDNGE